MEAEIKGSFWMRRTRQSVYQMASLGGFHTSQDKGQSIRYEGKTLQIRVAFKTLDAARFFMQELHALADFADVLSARPIVGYPKALTLGDVIYGSQYNAADTKSPVASVSSHSTRTTATAVEEGSEMFRHQRIEPGLYVHGAGFFCSCHIKDMIFCTPAEADDPNNRLTWSPNFRSMFCGEGSRARQKGVPRIRISVMAVADNALSYDKTTGGTEMRWEVTLMVEFFDEIMYRAMTFADRPIFKDGSSMIEGDCTRWRTTVNVLDPVRFQEYIKWKYDDTTDGWDC